MHFPVHIATAPKRQQHDRREQNQRAATHLTTVPPTVRGPYAAEISFARRRGGTQPFPRMPRACRLEWLSSIHIMHGASPSLQHILYIHIRHHFPMRCHNSGDLGSQES